MSRSPRVCVFCGSSPGHNPTHAEAARRLGDALARLGIGLVYGGGRVGLMGIVADAALAAGGHVLGVIPDPLATREVAHPGLPDLRVVPGMHERKALMAAESDAFLTLPGGIGTYEEFFEILTWAALGLHHKPLGLLNVAGYFDPLLALLDQGVAEGFIRPEHRALVVVSDSPEGLAGSILNHRTPASGPAVIRPDET